MRKQLKIGNKDVDMRQEIEDRCGGKRRGE